MVAWPALLVLMKRVAPSLTMVALSAVLESKKVTAPWLVTVMVALPAVLSLRKRPKPFRNFSFALPAVADAWNATWPLALIVAVPAELVSLKRTLPLALMVAFSAELALKKLTGEKVLLMVALPALLESKKLIDP